MLETELNFFDISVFLIVAISGLIAFIRGFLREVSSLSAWIGAALITIFYAPEVVEMLKPYLNTSLNRYLVGVFLLFFGSFIIISLIGSILIKYLRRDDDVGIFDNIMGLLFGLIRGSLIVALCYLVLDYAYSENKVPEFVERSVTVDYAKFSAGLLIGALPEHLAIIRDKSGVDKNTQKKINSSIDDYLEQQRRDSVLQDDKGYDEDSRKSLDAIMDKLPLDERES